MVYRKRYEDAYLDDEDFDEEGNEVDQVSAFIQSGNEERAREMIRKFSMGATMLGEPGKKARKGLVAAATAYGDSDTAMALWAEILDAAETVGDKELYYLATDKLSGL